MSEQIVRTDGGFQLLVDQRPVASIEAERRGDELWITPKPAGPASHELIAALWARAAENGFADGCRSAHVASDIDLDHDDPALAEPAGLAGFDQIRDLLQLRRPLPIAAGDPVRRGQPPLPVRAFRPGTADESAWVRTNNRAFAHHPDQGNETVTSLQARETEPWFDPAGFLVLDEPDRDGMAGFCWTKVHPAAPPDPALGEIYVIGVDPGHEGEGLGRSLVLAGLDHLAAGGLSTAMLYVDAANERALILYDKLGFVAHLRRRVRTRRAGR